MTASPSDLQRVLVVAGEALRPVLEAALASPVRVVRSAATIADARSSLVSWDPDAVVLDLALPDGGGLDILHALLVASARAAVGHVRLHAAEEALRAAMVAEALARAHGSRHGAARMLAVSRQLLQHILRKGACDASPVRSGADLQATLARRPRGRGEA